MRTITTVLLVLLFCTVLSLDAKTIKVPQDYAKIQLAINAAVNGDTVLVAEGTYFENILISKKIVLGSLFITDGDTAHVSKTILDGGSPTNADSASVIRIFSGADSSTVITGFTIQNGRGTKLDLAGSHDWMAGGGIRIFAGGVKLTHNIILNNILNSSLGVYGGGIAIDPVTGPVTYWVIEHNRIINNTITSSNDAAEGAGVWMSEDGRFLDNEVSYNIASSTVTYSAGGGIFLLPMPGYGAATIFIANNTFRKNQALNGGCLWMGAHTTLVPRPFVTLQNNLIIENIGTSGSAMNVVSGDFILINNTIAKNLGNEPISLFNTRGSLTFRLVNNIIWNPNSVIELSTGVYSTSASYNCIRGGFSGTGNINSDPLFVPNDSLYRLSNSSPCISAGIYRSSVGGMDLFAPKIDFFAQNRPRPAGTRSDMGAIEHDSGSILDVTLDVKELDPRGIPNSLALNQNYPNPFNPSTTIRYALPSSAHVTLSVFNVLGQVVSELVNEQQSAGWKEVRWDASGAVSGIYFYRLLAHNFVEVKKMQLLK